jgi:hypothetical protein
MYKGSKVKEPIVSPVMGVPKGEARARKARKAPPMEKRPREPQDPSYYQHTLGFLLESAQAGWIGGSAKNNLKGY